MINNDNFYIKWKTFLKESKSETLNEVSILKNKYPFKALYVLGPPGAGKTTLQKNIGMPSEFKISNPDVHIEKIFPLFNISLKFIDSDIDLKKINIELLQQVSRSILQRATVSHTENLLSIASPIIFDTTGENFEKTVKKMINLTKLGYDVGIIIVNVPPSFSVKRDATRERSVGAKKVLKIAHEFQNIIKDNMYTKLANSESNISMLGSVLPNIFDTQTGELYHNFDKNDLKLQQFQNLSVEHNQKILSDIKNDLHKWLHALVNPKGKIVLEAMRKLVQISKGRLGQNMNDIILATSMPELVAVKEIELAANLLSGVNIKTMLRKASGREEKEMKPLIAPTIRHAIKKFKE